MAIQGLPREVKYNIAKSWTSIYACTTDTPGLIFSTAIRISIAPWLNYTDHNENETVMYAKRCFGKYKMLCKTLIPIIPNILVIKDDSW